MTKGVVVYYRKRSIFIILLKFCPPGLRYTGRGKLLAVEFLSLVCRLPLLQWTASVLLCLLHTSTSHAVFYMVLVCMSAIGGANTIISIFNQLVLFVNSYHRENIVYTSKSETLS